MVRTACLPQYASRSAPTQDTFSKTELGAVVEPGCPPIDFALKGPLLGPPVPDPTMEPPKEKGPEPTTTPAKRPAP